MLREKSITVFDKDTLKIGHLITFCYTSPDDNGEIEESGYKNGIIESTFDDVIYIIDGRGRSLIIDLENVINDKIRILGVRKDAI